MFDDEFTKKILRYVKDFYGDEAEFLWEKSPDAAALRHKSGKWYGVLMNVAKEKLGISGEGRVDILDVKCDPALVGSLTDGKGILPGYHMNKEHWISILLDGSVPEEQIFGLIDMSYAITDRRVPKKK